VRVEKGAVGFGGPAAASFGRVRGVKRVTEKGGTVKKKRGTDGKQQSKELR